MSEALRARNSRLGKGLSSLMGQLSRVVEVPVPAGVGQPGGEVVISSGLQRGSESTCLVAEPAMAQAEGAGGSSAQDLVYLEVSAIEPTGLQPRQDFDSKALEGLAQSIRSRGLMQPVVVRPKKDVSQGVVKYELIAGERRWRAARLAGLERIPALVREMDDREALEVGLIENLQRQDLNAIERARAFAELAGRFGLSHEQIAQVVGLDRATVTNTLRLLSLCEEVQELVRRGLLTAGQARAIASLEDREAQVVVAQKAIRKSWSVRQVEAAVRQMTGGGVVGEERKKKDGLGRPVRAAYLAELEEQIGQQLGTRVHIRKGRKKGSGTLMIEFYSLEQFDELLARMGVKVEGL